MSLINPSPINTTAARPVFPYLIPPYTNGVPMTYRDGMTFLRRMEGFAKYIDSELLPWIDEGFKTFVDAFNSSLTDIRVYMEAQQLIVDNKISGFTELANKAIADVNAIVVVAQSAKDAAVAARNEAETFAANTVELQDTAVSALLLREASKTNNAFARKAAETGSVESAVMLGQVPRNISYTPPANAYGKGFGLDIGSRSPKINNGGTGYAVGDTITLAGGTYSTQAYVTVTAVNAGAVTAVQTTRSGLYTVIPTDALIGQAATSGGGTGVVFNTVNWTARPTAYKEGDYVEVAPNDPRIRYYGYGLTDLDGKGTYGNAPGTGTDSIWEFDTDASRIEIHTKANRTTYMVYVDGRRIVPQQRGQTDATGAFIIDQIAFGSKGMHSYKIIADRMALTGIRYAVADGAIFRAPTRTRPLVWSLGDSYLFGIGADNWKLNMFGVMCECLDVDGLPDGVSAARWDTSTAGDAPTRVGNTLAKMNVKPAFIFWDLGYNNQYQQSDMNAITTAMTNAINAAKAAAPAAKHIAFSPATPLGDTAALATLRAAMNAVYAANGVTVIDVTDWVNENNKDRYTDADNIHPTNIGHYYLGARRAQAVRYLNIGL